MRKGPALPRIILILTLGLSAAALPIYAVKVAQKTDYTDFDVYYRAGSRIKAQEWKSVYNLADGASPFRYAPVTLPLFRPFASLPAQTAKVVWFFFQFLFFAGGFYLIFRSLKPLGPNPALPACLAALFIFRFCLDTFTIGQVSSLMFLGYCLALYGWMGSRSLLAGAGLFIPALLKIGPAMGYFLFLLSDHLKKRRALIGPFFLFLLLLFLLYRMLPLPRWHEMTELFKSWTGIVAKDSVYYDASHYGSQSLKSMLLRAVKHGQISGWLAASLHIAGVLAGSAAILLFWLLRAPRSAYGRGLFFSLFIFANIWFMPETFKYSLTPIAIPMSFLFASPRKTALHYLAFALGFMVLSLAGLDLVGETAFFWLQSVSAPFWVTAILGALVWKEAWEESEPSFVARVAGLPMGHLGPWEEFPAPKASLEASFLYALPLHTMDAPDPSVFQAQLERVRAVLSHEFQADFEIIIVPYGDHAHPDDPVLGSVKQVLRHVPNVVLLDNQGASARASALREAFTHSRGKIILASNAEQPCDPEFYERALRALGEGYEFVRANRRLPETRFQIPVRVLPLVYRRHRLGLRFNRLVRLVLPIDTTDTHSGSFAMTRGLALAAFSVQSSPDFLADLEWHLAAKAHSAKTLDLPVTLYLGTEKTQARMVAETLSILRGLPTLAYRYRLGCYGPMPRPEAMTADDWGLSPGVNQGILDLAKKGVIRRVSIMSTCPYASQGLSELKSVPGISLGLHFNLTYGKRPLGSLIPDHSGFAKLFLLWMNPFSKRAELVQNIRTELESQLSALSSLGIKPQYMDGHHHIHLLPGLLSRLIDILRHHGISQVRIPSDPALGLGRKFPIFLFSLLAKRTLSRNGFHSLPCVYPDTSDYWDPGRLRAKIVRNLNCEVITHPAEINDLHALEFPDTYTAQRTLEFRSLRMLAAGWEKALPSVEASS